MNRYVSKTTNRFEFRFKNQTIQKFDICLDGFFDRNFMQSAIQIKSDKNSFIYSQCVLKECLKT